MTVKCTNPGKNVNISLNTEYEVIKEANNRYTIVNDKGVEKNYDTKLFREIIVAKKAQTKREIVEEVPVIKTEAAVKYNIETDFSYDDDNDTSSHDVKVTINDKEVFNGKDLNIFEYTESQISCGIWEAGGVNNLLSEIARFKGAIKDKCKAFNIDFSGDLKLEQIIGEILATILQDIIDDMSAHAGIIVMSTNITNNEFLKDNDKLWEVFNEKADSMLETYNPNSENTIRMWSFDTQD